MDFVQGNCVRGYFSNFFFTLNGMIDDVIKFLRFLIILGMFSVHRRSIGNNNGIENAQATIIRPS